MRVRGGDMTMSPRFPIPCMRLQTGEKNLSDFSEFQQYLSQLVICVKTVGRNYVLSALQSDLSQLVAHRI